MIRVQLCKCFFTLCLIIAALTSGKIYSADLIIRGSTFCLPEGRRGYERPLFNECLLVVPKGHSEFSTTTSATGVFDLHLPLQPVFLNNPLFIDFQNGQKSVGNIRLIIDSANLDKENGNLVYELDAPIILSCDCEDLSADADSCYKEYLALTTPSESTPNSWFAKNKNVAVAMVASSAHAQVPTQVPLLGRALHSLPSGARDKPGDTPGAVAHSVGS